MNVEVVGTRLVDDGEDLEKRHVTIAPVALSGHLRIALALG